MNKNIYLALSQIGLFKLEASTGIPVWNIRNSKSTYMDHSVLSKKYLWAFFRKNTGSSLIKNPNIIRINLETLEIMKLDTSELDYSYWWGFAVMGDSLYLPSNGSILYKINQETGVVEVYDVYDYFDYGDDKPHISENLTFNCHEREKMLNIYNPESPFEPVTREEAGYTDIVQHKILDYSTSYLYCRTNKHIFQNGIFLDEDETRMFAVDMKTGKEIWWIDKTKLENPWRLLIIDSRGILISQGYRLTCFRAIDEQ